MESFFRLIRSGLWRHRAVSGLPYDALADSYDLMMKHVDYYGWALYIDKICREFGSNIERVVFMNLLLSPVWRHPEGCILF